jgi:hypothetical protein
MLANSLKLDYWTRYLIKSWTQDHKSLQEAYEFKERVRMLYRCKRGYLLARQSRAYLLIWGNQKMKTFGWSTEPSKSGKKRS